MAQAYLVGAAHVANLVGSSTGSICDVHAIDTIDLGSKIKRESREDVASLTARAQHFGGRPKLGPS